MKKVTVLGGGTGSYVVLSGLKERSNIDLAVIVNMMDSGGSTGRLRDQLGVLPPGDLRQCLVALSDAPLLWRELFLYRFEQGDLKGHNFGNIFLSALEKVSENYDEVMETVEYVLKIKGQVIPVTFSKTNLAVEYESGRVLKGETNIDENNFEQSRIIKAYLEPQIEANPKAIKRILESDVIIVGPGDLYTSIIPILLVKGIRDAVLQSKAKIIYILNLMNKMGQTVNYKGNDYLHDIEHYLGNQPDVTVVNKGDIPTDILNWYKNHDEYPVENDLQLNGYRGEVAEGDLVDKHQFPKTTSDLLTRSILRHDSKKLTELLVKHI